MIKVREGRLEDAQAVQALTEQLGYPAPLEAIWERLSAILEHSDHRLLVAETEGGDVVGWVHGMLRTLLEEPTHIFLGGLVVDEQQRNQGLGARLMGEIESWGRSLGANEIHVYSNVVRERAHKFYESQGYSSDKVSKVLIKGL